MIFSSNHRISQLRQLKPLPARQGHATLPTSTSIDNNTLDPPWH